VVLQRSANNTKVGCKLSELARGLRLGKTAATLENLRINRLILIRENYSIREILTGIEEVVWSVFQSATLVGKKNQNSV